MASFTAPCAAAMYLSVDSIISASRTTTCDVMCTTNTPSVYKVPGELPSFQKEKADATLPYKHNLATKPPKGNTAFTLYKNIESKNSRSNDMKRERDEFFGKMERDRREKMERELVAVVKLQAFVRGILVRPWPEETRKSKKPPIIQVGMSSSAVVQKIQDELCSYSVHLGLKPISGLSLENRYKQNKRRNRIELAAAMRLQSYFRMIKCIMLTRRRLTKARETMKQRASLVITKFFKWVRRVAEYHKMQNANRNSSVVKIQTRFRMFVAYHRVKKMKIQRYYARRTHDAQIIIRRNLYDGMRRKEKERKVQEEKEVSKEE
jgi:hypothetical protein